MKVNLLKKRWIEIEERASQLVEITTELDEINEDVDDYNIKNTTAYMLLQQELKMLYAEQLLIEKSGAMQ